LESTTGQFPGLSHLPQITAKPLNPCTLNFSSRHSDF
jgi:hypothetical protein